MEMLACLQGTFVTGSKFGSLELAYTGFKKN